MRKKQSGVILFSMMLVFGMLVMSCALAKAPTPEAKTPAGYESLRMYGGTIGGKAAIAVMAFASVFNKYYPEIEWSSCTGVTGVHPIYLTNGTAKLAMALPDGYIEAYGVDKMAGSRLRSISLPTPLTQYIFLIPQDKPWKDITQVPKGLTLCPGAPGTSVPVVAEAWLRLCGLSKKDFNWVPMGQGELTDGWRAGKVDFTLQSLSSLNPTLIDMQSSPRKIKAMGLSPDQAAKAKAEQTFERIGLFAPSESNMTEIAGEVFKYDVVCPQQPSFLSCRDDFPEQIAYKMARTIDEHREDLAKILPAMKYGTPEWHIRWAKPPYDIHPGVAKYYREKGYLK